LVDATGRGLFLAVSVLYFTRFAGLSAGSVALGLSLAGLAALIGAVPLGSLGDRFGHRRVWVLLTAVQSAVFAAYPLVRTFPEFVALATVAALAEPPTGPPARCRLSRSASSNGSRVGRRRRPTPAGVEADAPAGGRRQPCSADSFSFDHRRSGL